MPWQRPSRPVVASSRADTRRLPPWRGSARPLPTPQTSWPSGNRSSTTCCRFSMPSASLRLVSPDGSLRTVARRGTTPTPDPIVDVVAPGVGISGAAITEGMPIQSSNILEDPRIEVPAAVRRWMVESGLVVWLSVPLRVIGKTIGALSIGDRAGRAVSSSEITLLQTFADQAALALQQAQLFEESEHRRKTAEALAEIGRLLSQTLDPRLVGTRIVDSVRTLLAAQSAVLYSLDPSGVLTAHTVSMDTGLVFDWTLRLEPGVGIAWLALDQRGSVMTPDAIADPRLVYRPESKARVVQSAHRALLAVPLSLQDRMLGVLVVADTTGRVYQERDAQLAQAFAAQAAIALENAGLYQDLQNAYDDLSHAQVQLAQAQKMEAIGQLAGGVAHDFNNLLTVISGRSALLLDQLPADDPVRKSVEPIQKSAERAATLTRQLLAFSRRQVLQPTVLDLNHLVTGLLPMLQSLLGESIELVSLPEANPGSVTVDPGQLEQVIVNLIVNARDAMPRGGQLTMRTATVTLDVESAALQSDLPPGPYVLLVVTDTGHGMSPEIQAKVFDPFFTTKGVGKGTGLGLSMAYGIISQHKGTITVESTEGQGSTFTIYLPQAIISHALSSAPGETAVGTSHGTETILLVDDQEDLGRDP